MIDEVLCGDCEFVTQHGDGGGHDRGVAAHGPSVGETGLSTSFGSTPVGIAAIAHATAGSVEAREMPVAGASRTALTRERTAPSCVDRCMHRLALLFALTIGCGAPPAPIQNTRPPIASAAPTPPDDALCCCTFAFADPEDFGEVNTWDSLATTCPIGDADRMPGQCIDWKWCKHPPGKQPRTLADRPDLAPKPPLAASKCCCDIFDGHGENFSVLDAEACAHTPDAHCVASEFCGVPSRD